MTDQVQDSSMTNFSIKHGLLIGLVSIVLSIVFYIIDPLMQFTNYWISIIILVLVITLLVVLGLDVRKKIGGYWSFGQAFKSIFIMGIILSLFSVAYNFVLFKFVDPQLPVKANSAILESLTARLNSSNVSQDKIDEYTKSFQNGEFIAKLQPTLINEIKAFGYGLILYVVLSLIIAACIKKKAPLYATPLEGDTSV
ncbi:DUF4199 domain-containing protein [Mucilaginibacter sp. OK098]|uniref:DUF4199 domain-containing protein n=1 Tax=Mucilaginibacter sp. OK098 TaxID=1855297 RepID=UPI00091CA0AE|nr:DUF4199 domain-containing protein [Mucilaginibacter sp. OK098]SHM10906.1 Protein of unknown function [Mucilaginibacter sp. OK098]